MTWKLPKPSAVWPCKLDPISSAPRRCFTGGLSALRNDKDRDEISITSTALELASHQPLAPGKDGDLRAVGEMQLAENVAHIAFHGLFAEDEPPGNVGVAQPRAD